MNKKEIAQQFTKQMLDPNQPPSSFEQLTNMLKEIEQTHQDDFQYRSLSNSISDVGKFVFPLATLLHSHKDGNNLVVGSPTWKC